MSDLGHVLILAGGLSYEREVSIRSGRRVAEVLRAAGVDVETRDADATLVPGVLADPPDAVFVTLHGGAGEDGAIRSVLELLGVPYVGATPDACRVAFDKPTAKAVVRSWGLNTPDSVALPKETFHDLGATAVLARIIDQLGLPLFVKPSRGGSALGASMVRTAEELPAAMVGCFAYGDTALIERYIQGVEVSVSVVDLGDGPVALPPVEIVPDRGVYDYAARYTAGQTEFFAPARLSPEVTEACRRHGGRRPHRARPARHLPHRHHRRCRRQAVLPRSERGPRHDGDLSAAHGGGGRWPRSRHALQGTPGARRRPRLIRLRFT